MYGLKRTTPPAVEPVTLRQIKQQLAIHPNDLGEDVRLVRLARVAREKVENNSGYCCLTQTWQLSYDHWLREIYLPRKPVVSIDKFEGRDPDNTWQEAAPTDYELDDSRPVARLRVLPSSIPPLHAEYKPLVRITFTCGHPSAAEVPEEVKSAILRQTEDEERYRGSGEYQGLADAVYSLIESFKMPDEFLQYGRGEYAGLHT